MSKLEYKFWGVWLGFLLLLFFMTGCASKKTFESSQTVKDSVWVKKTIKPVDTVLKVPATHTRITEDWKTLSDNVPVIKKDGKLTATLTKKGDTIIAECNQEELELTIQLQNELLEVYRQRETEKTQVKTATKTDWGSRLYDWLIILLLLVFVLKSNK